MGNIKKISTKTIAFLLALIMVIYTFPLNIIAEEVRELWDKNTTEEQPQKTKDIFEIIDRREENVKHFRLEDGSFIAVQYETPVHYMDEVGKWQDIDNTLSEAKDDTYSTSNARVKFAKKINGNENILTLHDKDVKLSLSLDGAVKKSKAVATNTETKFAETATKLDKLTTLDKLTSSIKYEDVLKNVDLEYVVTSNNIKENIIVKSKCDSYTYTFTLQLNNLIAELKDDGYILILNEKSGEVQYTIPAAFMFDANGEMSYNIKYTLNNISNGKYSLTVTADPNWINDEKRAFPVTIDPPVYGSNSTVVDVDISSSSPNYTGPSSSSLYVSSTWRSYWKTTQLPTLPNSAYITKATFKATCFTSTEMHGYVGAYDVSTDWNSTLTWNEVISTTNPLGVIADDFTDYQEIMCYYDGEEYCLNDNFGYSWTITPIVKKWYAGQNYGLALSAVQDTTFTGIAKFRSSEYTNLGEVPQLCVSYRDMKGLEGYWSTSSQSAGFAGVGSVNNATGNLAFGISTLTSTDALMPFTPALIYNSAIAGQEYAYPNVQTSYWGSDAPMGFKLNIQETLLKKNYFDENGIPRDLFIWADSDGTEHYFLLTETTATERIYKDEDGLLLTLHEYISTTICTIIDSSKNIKTFSKLSSQPTGTISGWYLSSITDYNGNKVVFGFESGPRPISINLVPKYNSSIEQLRIAYENGYNPYVIWNPTSNEAVIFRYSSTPTGSISTYNSNYLRQVIRVHGTSAVTQAEWRAFYDSNSNSNTSKIIVDGIADYTYSVKDDVTYYANGLLLSVTNNLSDYKVQYGYDSNNRVTSVKEWAVAGTSNIPGQELSLEYGSSSTVIRTSGTDDIFNTSDDLLTTYSFDDHGRPKSTYTTDINRTQIYGASNGQYVGEENENAKNNLKSSVQTSKKSSNYLLNGGFEDTAPGTIPYWNKTGNATGGYGITYQGTSCATLTVSSAVTTSTIYQNVYLDEGDYSLSMYINTYQSQGVDVYFKAISPSNSAHSVVKQIPVNEYYAAGSYAYAGLDFSANPSTTGGKELFIISIEVVGSPSSAEQVWVDNVMLSQTTGTAEYDMVKCGHFENSSSTYSPADFWKILDNQTTPVTAVDSGDLFGDVLKIDIGVDEFEFIEQVVYQATDDMKYEYDEGYYSDPIDPMLFTISGWGKGTAQGYAPTSLFGFRVTIKYYDGSTYGTNQSFDFNFDKGITDWQYMSSGFANDPSKGMIDKITIMIMYNGNPGVGYFDNISLVRDSNTTKIYDYNDNGYATTFKSGVNTTWYQYDDKNNVTCAISSNKTKATYEYDSYNRVKKEHHWKYTGFFNPKNGQISGVETELYYSSYGYNSFGQRYYTWTYDNSNTSKQISTFIEYNTKSGSHIFGTVKNEIDSLGNITRYFYNENNGRLLAVTYPKGNGICYEYDGMGNMTQVLPATLDVTEIEHEEYDEVDDEYYYWTEYVYDYNEDNSSASVTYGYDNNTKRLNTITTESTTYSFVYDVFGNTDEINVGSRNLASYEYNDNNGKLETLVYGNGHEVKYIYDILDRISQVLYNTGTNGAFETAYSYTYDAGGRIYSVTDHSNNEVTLYKYDNSGKLIQSVLYDEDTYTNIYGSTIYYDEQSRVSMVFHSFDYASSSGTTYDSTYYSYWYNDAGNLRQLTISGNYVYGTIKPTYDNLGRTTQKIIDFNVNSSDAFYNKVTYQYKSNGYNQSALVSQYKSEIGVTGYESSLATTTYNYTYDVNGNITEIKNASNTTQNKYYYDNLGQLTREDNLAKNKTYTYTYDNAGNITTKRTYAFTTGGLGTVQSTINYSYDDSTWGDLLTNYYGQHIEYDDIGNPVKIGWYDDLNGYWEDGYELTWNGRQLISYRYFEDYGMEEIWYEDPIEFSYNADGIRTSKTVYGTKHEYILSGSQIVAEKWNDKLLEYIYDEVGSPIGMKYRTPYYAAGVYDVFFFEKNLQGDIVAVYNSSGTKLVSYTYDAWGNCTTTYPQGYSAASKAALNPFRYRGYYYDTETGWYYLNSRYYKPSWGRFINADSYVNANGDLQGFNMFAYCSNNPVMFTDPTGTCIHNGSQIVDCPQCRAANLSQDVTVSYSTPINNEATHNAFWFDDHGTFVVSTSASGALTIGGAVFPYVISKEIRPNNIAPGIFAKQQTAYIDSTIKGFKRANTAASVIFVGFDIGWGINQNIQNNSPLGNTIYDASVDLVFSGGSALASAWLGAQAGALCGSAAPIVGNAVGAIVGFVAGLAIYGLVDVVQYNGKTARQHVKSWYN